LSLAFEHCDAVGGRRHVDRVRHRRFRLTGPLDLEYAHGILEASHGVLAHISEEEAFAGAQLPDG
jgi:hypothetical protein